MDQSAGCHPPTHLFDPLPQFKNFVIYTDSLSAVESLRCKTFKTKNVKRFYNLLKKIPPQTQMVIAWVPSHVGIPGNEKADRLAKAALITSLTAHSQVCWSDLKPRVDTYIWKAWQALWNNETRNKLYEIRPNLSKREFVQHNSTTFPQTRDCHDSELATHG